MSPDSGLSCEIFIVDDDATARDSLSMAFRRVGYQVVGFAEGMSLIAAARVRLPVCILMDIYLPGPSGLEILKQLDAARYPAPIIVLSGRGDVPSAVEAIKNGACDFIEKQMDAGSIVEHVRKAIDAWASRYQKDETSEIKWRRFPGRVRLTSREIDVLSQITLGAPNKVAAENLGISKRTIETHRRNIMKKLGAKNVVHLLRMVMSKDGETATKITDGARSDSVRLPKTLADQRRFAACHRNHHG